MSAVGGRGENQIQLGVALASVKDVDTLDGALLDSDRDLGSGAGGADVVDLDGKQCEDAENQTEDDSILRVTRNSLPRMRICSSRK